MEKSPYYTRSNNLYLTKIINMSIGTTLINDLVPIYNIVEQLIKQDVNIAILLSLNHI